MSYYGGYNQNRGELRLDHEKAWYRSKAIAWDSRWHALSTEARQAYLVQVKPPTKQGSFTHPSILADAIAPELVEELAKAGFVEVESGKGNKPAKLVALQAAYDFTSRLRSVHKYNLLGPSNRDNLLKYIKHAFFCQGESLIRGVLSKAGLVAYCSLDEGLKLYVTTHRWPEWALESCKAKAARPLYEALCKAEGPITLARLPDLVKDAKPEEIDAALTDLVIHLGAFEDVDPKTFELIVGLLPKVVDDLAEAARPRKRPPLVVVEHPTEVGPPGGLDVNDLRSFLLEVAGESPRLRRDKGIFQKDEPRINAALPPRPDWLNTLVEIRPDRRVVMVHYLANILKFTEYEEEGRTTWLRVTAKGRNWLSSSFEDQYARVFDYYRSTAKQKPTSHYYRDDDMYDYNSSYGYGDSKFLGVPVSVVPYNADSTRHFQDDAKPEQRDALRLAIYKAFQALPVGVYHRLDSVLGHASFAEHNPLTLGSDPVTMSIMIDRRQIARFPEQVESAGQHFLSTFLKLRLLPLDAIRAAIDVEGNLCIARLPRFDGYFGRPYKTSEDQTLAKTRVIVQPDFSVVVIGLDPSPAAELAPFCERAGGQAGQGVMTFKITRDSVIRATNQGLTATAIITRLKKLASVDIPANVLSEVAEWADWVRLVNVKPIMVIRCLDQESVARVVSALGKNAERLSDTLVALHAPKLTAADRMKLQEHGILVTKDDIQTVEEIVAAVFAKVAAAEAKKKARTKKAL